MQIFVSHLFSSQKNRQIKAGQNNKYDITKTSGLVQFAFYPRYLELRAISMKFAIDQKWEISVSLIVFASFLDNIDGKLARLLKTNSDFGVELDSLSDFLSFGIAPAIVVFLWSKSLIYESSWAIVIFYAILLLYK